VKSDEYIIQGIIGKVGEYSQTKPDDDKKGFVEEDHEDTETAFFIIDVRSCIMAYESRRAVGHKAPYRILEAVFNSYHEPEEKIETIPITDKQEVREEISKLQKISGVRFAGLRTANPDGTKHSRRMDEFLDDAHIDKLKLDGRNTTDEDKEGIKIEEDPLLDGGLSLAEEGYGTAVVSGETEDGEEIEVSTSERAITKETEMPKSDEAKREELLDQIREVLDELD